MYWHVLRVRRIPTYRVYRLCDTVPIVLVYPAWCGPLAPLCIWRGGPFSRKGPHLTGKIQQWQCMVASFPDLLHLQFLIACCMQKRRQAIRCRRPGNEARQWRSQDCSHPRAQSGFFSQLSGWGLVVAMAFQSGQNCQQISWVVLLNFMIKKLIFMVKKSYFHGQVP